MIVLGRHRPLTHDAWSELAVRAVIEEIAADAISHFDPEGFWPGHPSDDGAVDGNPSFYWGAPRSKAIRQPITQSMARCSSATWVRHFS